MAGHSVLLTPFHCHGVRLGEADEWTKDTCLKRGCHLFRNLEPWLLAVICTVLDDSDSLSHK